MIRFRFTEDERRYLRLRSEAYRLIAQRLDPQALSKVMRNFGKLAELVHFEGIRQGFGGAELSLRLADRGRQDFRPLKAFQAHAMVYGSTDTPLRDVELETLDSMSQNEDSASSAWLDKEPMRFAPQTLDEWAAEEQVVGTVMEPGSGEEPSLVDHFERMKTAGEVPLVEGDPPERPPFDSADWLALQDAKPEPEETDQPPSAPQFLDRVRDHLQAATEKYESWQDLIFKLHLGMQVDAGYLDLVLSTPEGLTVLAQCNQTHLHPGAEMNIETLRQKPE